MDNCSWDGQRVRLRAVRGDDAAAFMEHHLDSEANRLGNQVPYLRSLEDTENWIAKHTVYPASDNVQRAVETLNGGILVGSVNTHGCDARHGNFEYGVSIFREHWRKGYAGDAVVVLLRHFFLELRYHRALATVYAFNDASLAFHRRLGFVEEGCLRENLYTNGAWHDEHLFGMLRSEFEARYG